MNGILKNDILAIITDRNPNYVSELIIVENLISFVSDAIYTALLELIENEVLECIEIQNANTNSTEKFYRLREYQKWPVRRFIEVGDIAVPRLLADSNPRVFPELFNEQIERLAKHSQNLELRFVEAVKKEQEKYWSQVVGVLGVVVAVLAIVIVGLPKIQTDLSLPFWDVVLLNLSQLLPLGITLVLLVLALKWAAK